MNLNFIAYRPGDGGLERWQVDELVSYWPDGGASAATVGDGQCRRIDPGVRDSHVWWVRDGTAPSWLFEHLADVAADANRTMWRLDLWGVQSGVQLAQYTPAKTAFAWHTDCGPGEHRHRKLSISVQLSEPADYCGGELQFRTTDQAFEAPRERGAVILFPSVLPHRVAPVRGGCRMSAVSWVLGPELR